MNSTIAIHVTSLVTLYRRSPHLYEERRAADGRDNVGGGHVHSVHTNAFKLVGNLHK